MRRTSPLAAWLLPATLLAACAGGGEATPFDDEYPLAGPELLEGVPDNDSLPDDNKADAQYPKKFTELVAEQSPVKSQGRRGVCSIFATAAQVENLYIKAGKRDADFSEQYLQWSVKNEVGDFTNTEGSSGGSNLDAVKDFGIVEESVWPYEPTKWTEANDPACKGESMPVRCYTNGDPSDAVRAARKWKLPSNRYVNTNSIKAHLTSKRSGVVVGMTFFYQSWNHRASTLPVDSALWRQGIVTYPNAKDKEVSLAKRAGHAILIIGWDDELTAPVRDETGAVVKNPDGTDKTEKGFWLFKNSWGADSFGIENEAGGGYGWLSYKYVKEYGSAVASDVPTLEAPREVCDDAGMADEDRDGQANCDDRDCGTHPACAERPSAFVYEQVVGQQIPDDNSAGLVSSLSSTDTGFVGAVTLEVDIAHTYRGDLTVTLTHAGVTRTVFAGEGGAADDLKQTFEVEGFSGKKIDGEWRLTVVDGAAQDVGTLASWTLTVAGS